MKTHGKNCKKHLIQIAGMLRSYPVVTIDFHPFWAPNRSNFFFRQERQLQASKKERKTAIQQVPMGGTVLNPPIFGECFSEAKGKTLLRWSFSNSAPKRSVTSKSKSTAQNIRPGNVSNLWAFLSQIQISMPHHGDEKTSFCKIRWKTKTEGTNTPVLLTSVSNVFWIWNRLH